MAAVLVVAVARLPIATLLAPVASAWLPAANDSGPAWLPTPQTMLVPLSVHAPVCINVCTAAAIVCTF